MNVGVEVIDQVVANLVINFPATGQDRAGTRQPKAPRQAIDAFPGFQPSFVRIAGTQRKQVTIEVWHLQHFSQEERGQGCFSVLRPINEQDG